MQLNSGLSVLAEKSTGEAFAEYETAQEASEAQEDRNNRNLGERYIECAVYQKSAKIYHSDANMDESKINLDCSKNRYFDDSDTQRIGNFSCNYILLPPCHA